jgi:hypothetical protein
MYLQTMFYTGCIKMIGAVSICHYGFENARISDFPTWNETEDVQVHYAAGWGSSAFTSRRSSLVERLLPHRWIGRDAHEDLMFCPWPARSPDLTPCDNFFWGYVKDKVFVPPHLVSIPDLKNRIEAAVATITPDLLTEYDRNWTIASMCVA